MTRETKIGLLVGLAFIIVIGILLSDHINSTTDPAPAAMGEAYNSVVEGVAAPNQRDAGKMTMVPAPAPVIPQNPVPTSRQPANANNGSSVVVIGPGVDPSSVQRPARIVQQPNNVQALAPADNQVADNTPELPTTGVSDPLTNLVNQHQSELALVGKPPVGIPGAGPVNSNAANGAPANSTSAGLRIKAAEGDTLNHLAAKYMGGNTKAHRQAIIQANPSMTPDGHLVIIGRTYLIPATTASATPPASAPQVAQVIPAPAQRIAPKPAPVAAQANMYTVKDNDSLWKIASEELGSGVRWTEIRDLNKDVLKGGEQVHVNMRLKLPPKTVASAD